MEKNFFVFEKLNFITQMVIIVLKEVRNHGTGNI